jgi:hypothetical protein
MLKLPLSLPVVLVVVLSGIGQFAAAQTVKSAEAANRTVATSASAQGKKNLSAPKVLVLPELSPEQMAIADRVVLGKMPCELAAHISVKPDARGLGRFILELGRQKYSMVPVPTLTGAIRLEDSAAGVVWLQLSNKSMLMSQKQGRRLADDCASADQLIVAKELIRSPAPSLLDSPVRFKDVAQAGLALEQEISIAVEKAAN